MRRLRLYKDLAWVWPLISPPEEYAEETELFSKIIKQNSEIKTGTLLHLGCGGGHMDRTFRKYFRVTGVDISKDMLDLAKRLNPGIKYLKGDMRSVRLKEKFDAVAIPDSINYMLTKKDLRRAFLTAYHHLKPGGIFLTIVEECKERFKQNETTSSAHSKKDIDIVYIENHYDPNPRDTNFEVTFVYLIRRKGKLDFQTDFHLCGLFKLKTWHSLSKEIGFKVKQKKFKHSTFAPGHYLPLLICTKPLGKE